MILLDKNSSPQNTVFYLSSIIYGVMIDKNRIDSIQLYNEVNQKLNEKVNFTTFILAIDFLFLLDMFDVSAEGDIYSVY
ncbi:ABC-three component system middle component 6 [Streptococcus mitis]|jgi:hypothetical protein|uniref:ABC-three component system middle component 6 n=1 Tax=Streptococcus mitis TaxID=28037 RepID=UPI0022B79BE2|nr:ABC-three component system middle component 6 [Streptococcus mitis]